MSKVIMLILSTLFTVASSAQHHNLSELIQFTEYGLSQAQSELENKNYTFKGTSEGQVIWEKYTKEYPIIMYEAIYINPITKGVVGYTTDNKSAFHKILGSKSSLDFKEDKNESWVSDGEIGYKYNNDSMSLTTITRRATNGNILYLIVIYKK